MRARHIFPITVAVVTSLAAGLVTGGAAGARPVVTGQVRSTQWLLNHLTVGATYHAGYDRSLFKLWDSVGNGCDVRDEVLIRDAVHVTVGQGCYLTGEWRSPYDGLVTANSTDEQIDHVVALADAWGAGAWRWSPATREAYANDLGTSYDLLAVSAHSNESKGDDDPSEYLPPKTSFDCRYMADYVGVMWRWRLNISASLKSFLTDRLKDCGWPTLVEPPRPTLAYGSSGGGGSPVATSTPTAPAGGPQKCTKTSTGKCIGAGEYCKDSEIGTSGYDGNGRQLYCGPDGHWHYA